MPEPLNLDLLYDEAFPDDPFLSGRLRAEMERMGYGNAEAIRGDRLAEAEALLRKDHNARNRGGPVDGCEVCDFLAGGDSDA